MLPHLLVQEGRENHGPHTRIGLGLARRTLAIGPLRLSDADMYHQVVEVEVDVPGAETGEFLRAHRSIRAQVEHEPPADTDRFGERIGLGGSSQPAAGSGPSSESPDPNMAPNATLTQRRPATVAELQVLHPKDVKAFGPRPRTCLKRAGDPGGDPANLGDSGYSAASSSGGRYAGSRRETLPRRSSTYSSPLPPCTNETTRPPSTPRLLTPVTSPFSICRARTVPSQ